MKTKTRSFILILSVLIMISCKENNEVYLSKDILSLINDSDLIISGSVTATQSLKESFVSEHDPQLNWAVIQVDELLKGDLPLSTVDVLFASSWDVVYVNAPKFIAGDKGAWILKFEKLNEIIRLYPNLDSLAGYYIIDNSQAFINDSITINKIRNYLGK